MRIEGNPAAFAARLYFVGQWIADIIINTERQIELNEDVPTQKRSVAQHTIHFSLKQPCSFLLQLGIFLVQEILQHIYTLLAVYMISGRSKRI
jgi:hypothetical protein